YDGSPYCGWQLQAGQPSVQGAIEAAILAFSGEAARLSAAGRTDAGVHACGQACHFDLERPWPAHTVWRALNARLRLAGEKVTVLAADLVDEGFHARFSATGRNYLYRSARRPAHPAIGDGYAWWIRKPLDVPAMN